MSQENPVQPPNQAHQPDPANNQPDQAQSAAGAKNNADAIRSDALKNNAFLQAVLGRGASSDDTSAQPGAGAEPNPQGQGASSARPKDEPVSGSSAAKPAKQARPKPKRDPIAEAAAAGAAAGAAAVERLVAARQNNRDTTAQENAPPPPVSAEELRDLLPESHTDKARWIAGLAQAQPGKYGDIAKFVREAAAAQDKYARQWEKEHPGETFDPDDPEHDEFFEKWGMESKYPSLDKDIEQFRESLAEAERAADRKRIEELERAEFQRLSSAARPVAQQSFGAAIADALGQEFAEAYAKGELKAKLDADPLAQDTFSAAVAYASQAPWNGAPGEPSWEDIATEAVKFYSTGKLDHTSPVAPALIKLADELDETLAALPEAETVNDKGQRFISRARYLSLPEPQRRHYWIVGQAELLDYAARHVHAYAKAHAEQVKTIVEKIAPRLGYVPKNAAASASQAATQQASKQRQTPAPAVHITPAVPTPGAAAPANQRPRNAFLAALGVQH